MQQRTLLLVDDNPGDQRLAQEAMADGTGMARLELVYDGVEAMDYLKKRGRFVNSPRPALIILDLNLPRKDGREFLEELKHDQDLKRIPVIVLTSSKATEDILKSYDSHANCYIAKPADWHKFREVLKTIETFWLSIVELP